MRGAPGERVGEGRENPSLSFSTRPSVFLPFFLSLLRMFHVRIGHLSNSDLLVQIWMRVLKSEANLDAPLSTLMLSNGQQGATPQDAEIRLYLYVGIWEKDPSAPFISYYYIGVCLFATVISSNRAPFSAVPLLSTLFFFSSSCIIPSISVSVFPHSNLLQKWHRWGRLKLINAPSGSCGNEVEDECAREARCKKRFSDCGGHGTRRRTRR